MANVGTMACQQVQQPMAVGYNDNASLVGTALLRRTEVVVT